jgi:hypothetical protein
MTTPASEATRVRLLAKRLGEVALAAVSAGEAFDRYAEACDAGERAGLVAVPAMALALADVKEKTEKLIAAVHADLEADLRAFRGSS